MEVELLVEGYTDEVFVRRCFDCLGVQIGTVYGKRGVGYVVDKAAGFAARGEFSPILIIADFADLKVECVFEARLKLVANPPARAVVRLAVNEIESWLMASRRELAAYIGVSVTRVPINPDLVADPKRALVNLARNSRKPRIKKMFVPRPGVSSEVGTGYVDGFTEFITNHWDLNAAVETSPSFARFIMRAKEAFVEE